MTVQEIPLEEFERLAFEIYFFKDNGLETYRDRNRFYEYMVAVLIKNDRKKDVPIYTEKIITDYERELAETIQEYGELSERALWDMYKLACVYYDEIATSDCQSREFYERGLKYAQKFLAVSEKAGNDEYTIKAMKRVAKGFKKLGRDEESAKMTAKLLGFLKFFVEKTIAKYGENSSESYSAMYKLADEYDENYSESLKIWQRMYDVFVKNGNEEFIDEKEYNGRCSSVIFSLAELYNKMGRYEDEAVMREEYLNLPNEFNLREIHLEDWAEALEKAGQKKELVKVWFRILMSRVFEEPLYKFSVLRVISRLVYICNSLSDAEFLLDDKEIKNMSERLVEICEDKVQSMNEARENGEDIDDDIYYKTLNALANVYYLSGQYDKELKVRQEVWNSLDVDSDDDYIEIMTNIADNFKRAGIAEESQVRESIAEYIGLVDATKEHYWDWDY